MTRRRSRAKRGLRAFGKAPRNHRVNLTVIGAIGLDGVRAMMAYEGLDLQAAVDRVIDETLEPGDGGIIALDPAGRIAMRYNTPSMLRGAADSSGRFEVMIWDGQESGR